MKDAGDLKIVIGDSHCVNDGVETVSPEWSRSSRSKHGGIKFVAGNLHNHMMIAAEPETHHHELGKALPIHLRSVSSKFVEGRLVS